MVWVYRWCRFVRGPIDRCACLKVEISISFFEIDLDFLSLISTFWARLANDDISTCTWPMIANEDALDIYLTSLTSSRPRFRRKRYSSPRNLLVFRVCCVDGKSCVGSRIGATNGPRGRRRAGGLHLSHVQWVGRVVGGFHSHKRPYGALKRNEERDGRR